MIDYIHICMMNCIRIQYTICIFSVYNLHIFCIYTEYNLHVFCIYIHSTHQRHRSDSAHRFSSSFRLQLVSTTISTNSKLKVDCLSSTYRLLHLECHSISISKLNLSGLFSTERGKRDLEN